MKIYNDPFEHFLAKVIQECVEDMKKCQPQDLRFIPAIPATKNEEENDTKPDKRKKELEKNA